MNAAKDHKNLNKAVLITGITGGIGGEVANCFANEGWNIVGQYYSSEKKAEELNKMISNIGVSCNLFKADFSKKESIQWFIRKIQKFQIDSVINNAGTYMVSKYFSKLEIYDLVNTFMVNIFAPILISTNVFSRMKENKFGRIVNISSIAAKYGSPYNSLHYGCSKLALEGLTKTLARDGASCNVLVNTIRPGVIDTAFHKKSPKDIKKRIAMIPLKKMGVPKDIAEMAYYLGSDKNNFITNSIIPVAGGE